MARYCQLALQAAVNLTLQWWCSSGAGVH